MAKPTKTVFGGALVTVVVLVTMGQLAITNPATSNVAQAQEPIAREQSVPRAKYVGITKCAACHFKQYEDWKASPHGTAFENLPVKYRNDSKCLECHVTGHSQPANSSQAGKAKLVGVSCEACHGPGSNHANLALSYVGQEKLLTEAAIESLHASIQKTALDQCIRCHTAMSHKPHPEFDRDDLTRDSRTKRRPKSLFVEIHD